MTGNIGAGIDAFSKVIVCELQEMRNHAVFRAAKVFAKPAINAGNFEATVPPEAYAARMINVVTCRCVQVFV